MGGSEGRREKDCVTSAGEDQTKRGCDTRLGGREEEGGENCKLFSTL